MIPLEIVVESRGRSPLPFTLWKRRIEDVRLRLSEGELGANVTALGWQ